MVAADVDPVAHHVAGGGRARRAVITTRTVFETRLVATAILETRPFATFFEARLALATSSMEAARANLIRSKEIYIQLVGKAPENLEAPPPLPKP